MLLGSMLAGMAFANAPVAAVHALAYPIGAIFHVPHGLSNALVLAQVLEFNLPAAEALYAELAGDHRSGVRSHDERGQRAAVIDEMTAIGRDCKVPASLSAVGIGRGRSQEARRRTR